MIAGPLGGYIIKKFDTAITPRITIGFEMLVNNTINHGTLRSIGITEAKVFCKSIFFLLETNPDPRLEALLSY